MSSRLWDADMSVQALEDLGLIGPLEWVPSPNQPLMGEYGDQMRRIVYMNGEKFFVTEDEEGDALGTLVGIENAHSGFFYADVKNVEWPMADNEGNEVNDPETVFEAPFFPGDRVLFAPTGQWATVVSSFALETVVTFDDTGSSEYVKKNGDLIPEDDVDPDPDDRGEGEVIYKVEIGEKDLYTDDYEAAETAYNLAVNAGEDHCRVWVQTWYEDVDDPDEDIILSNSPN